MIGLLSRVTAEFRHIDQPLRQYLGSLPGFDIKTPEQIDGYAGGSGTLAKLWQFVQASQVVVHLVGEQLGSLPDVDRVTDFLKLEPEIACWIETNNLFESSWTYTQWEAYLFLFQRSRWPARNILIFICIHEPAPKDALDLIIACLGDLDPDKVESLHPQRAAQGHLDALKRLGCRPEIHFRDAENLILELMASAFGRMVHSATQNEIIELPALTQRLKDSSPAQALCAWPQTIGNSKRWLERPELDQIIARIHSSESSITLLLGEPGSGKSALMARLGDLAVRDFQLIAIKADDLPSAIATKEDLDRELNLPEGTDAVTSILRMADVGPVIVLLDQLDALAQLIVDNPARLRLLVQLIAQLAGKPKVHVVASCRSFERSHDPTLRRIAAEEIQLALPEWEDVASLLTEIGISADGWNAELKQTLRSPHALSLFVDLHESDSEYGTLSNYQQMLDRLWEQRIDSGQAGIGDALRSVVNAIADYEQLQIPKVRLPISLTQTSCLIASGFLVESGPRIGFRHQTYYEHARVRDFAREPQRFINDIRAKQHILRARPQFWHGLHYLREADPHGFDTVLIELWRSADLRPHLRMMLLEFVGQQKAPRNAEMRCMGAMLDDACWLGRALSTMVGNSAWFAWLVAGRLPEIMGGPERYQDWVAQVLGTAMKFDQKSALELMSSYWSPRPELDRISWLVLNRVQAWDWDALGLLTALIKRNDHLAMPINACVRNVAAQNPAGAAVVLRTWLDRQSALDRLDDESLYENSKDTDSALDLEREASCAHKKRSRPRAWQSQLSSSAYLAARAPAEFCQQICPWFLETIQVGSFSGGSSVLIGYALSSIHADLDDELHIQNDIVNGLDIALRTWAAQDPDACLRYLMPHFGIESELSQRLIARALQPVCAHAPNAVLDYLISDNRRLMLGACSKYCHDSWALISALAPVLSDDQREILTNALMNWSPYRPSVAQNEPAQLEQFDIWRRVDRLRLFRAIPPACRGQSVCEFIDAEAAALPVEPEPKAPIQVLPSVRSSISLADMQAMTDGELISAIRDCPDQNHPAGGDARGGSRELSHELGTLGKVNPTRAIYLIDQLIASTNSPEHYGRYVEAVLSQVSQSDDAEGCMEFADRLLSTGFGQKPSSRTCFGYAMCNLLDRIPSLPERFITVLESWLARPRTPHRAIAESPEESACRPIGSVLSHNSPSITSPGGNHPILRALSRTFVQSQPAQLDRWLCVLEMHVQRVEDPAVWCALSLELKDLRECDPKRASSFISHLLRAYPQIMDRALGAQIAAQALRWCSEADALLWISSFAKKDSYRSQQAAGELLALRHFWQPDDVETARLFKMAIADASSSGANAGSFGIGLAYAAVRFWREESFRALAHPYWLELAKQPGEALHEVLMGIFDRVDHRKLAANALTRDVLLAVQAQPAMLRCERTENFCEQIVQLLEQNRWEAELIGKLALEVASIANTDDAKRLTYLFHGLEAMNDVVMLLQNHQEPYIQQLGTDLLERLLEHGNSRVQGLLRDLDRRVPES